MKNLKFSGGYVYYNNLQSYICPLNYFIIILNQINTNEDTNYIKYLYQEISKYDSYILYQEISKLKILNFKKIILFLEIIQGFGLGKIELKSISDTRIIFKQDKIYLSNIYNKNFKSKLKNPLELFLSGFLLNFLKFLYKKQIKLNITNKYGELYFEFIILNEDFNISFKNKYEFYSGSISSILKKTIISNKMVLNNGILKIWKAYAVIIPYFTLLELFSNLDSNKYKSFFNSLGQMQGKASLDFHKEYFGVDNKKAFFQVIKLSDISGIGKNIVNKNNLKVMKTELNLNSYFIKYYPLSNIHLLSFHLMSIFKGLYEAAFNKNTCMRIDKNIIQLSNISSSLSLTKEEKEILKYLNTKFLISNFYLQ